MKPTTTTNANGSRAQQIAAALDDAIAALTKLDATKLEAIEGRVAELTGGGCLMIIAANRAERESELREIASRHHLLGMLLATTDLNLAVLDRLHDRHAMGDSSWVR